MAHGQRAVALVISLNDKLRQEAINYALGALTNSPWKDQLVLPRGTKPDEEVSRFGIRRPEFRRIVRFEGGVASAGGYSGRGRALVGCALDEFAFFRGEDFKVNDKDMFSAVTARVLPGGQVILASTAWIKSGEHYEQFSTNHGKHETAIAIRATTEELNPIAWVLEMVARERLRDPDNAKREYDAEFIATAITILFDPDLLRIKRVAFETPKPGDLLRAGMDLGFTRNSATLSVVALRDKVILPVLLMEFKPEPGLPLMPGVVIGTFARELKALGIGHAMGDGHYKQSAIEHFVAHQLGFVDAPIAPADAFMHTRTLLKDDRLRVPDDDVLVRQATQAKLVHHSGGRVSVVLQQSSDGSHGDKLAAWVLACYQAGGIVVQEPPPAVNTEAWWQKERERMRKEAMARNKGAGDRGARAFWRAK